MSFDLHFTPPGDIDSSWTSFPARSHCCPDYTSVRIALLVMGSSYPIFYDPGIPAQAARIAALNALFDSTDPADLGVGYWIARWNFGTEAAEIIEGSVSGYVGAQHFDGTSGGSTMLARAKMAVQFGWDQPGGTPPWRAIDGETVTVSWYVRTEPLDDSGNRTLGSTVGDVQTLDLDIAPDDTEAWSDWVAFEEPAGNFAVTVLTPPDDGTHPSYAYADRECLGDEA